MKKQTIIAGLFALGLTIVGSSALATEGAVAAESLTLVEEAMPLASAETNNYYHGGGGHHGGGYHGGYQGGYHNYQGGYGGYQGGYQGSYQGGYYGSYHCSPSSFGTSSEALPAPEVNI